MSQHTLSVTESFHLEGRGTVVSLGLTDILPDTLPMEFPVTVLMPSGIEYPVIATPTFVRKHGYRKDGVVLMLEGEDCPKEIPTGSKLVLPSL